MVISGLAAQYRNVPRAVRKSQSACRNIFLDLLGMQALATPSSENIGVFSQINPGRNLESLLPGSSML